MIEVPHLPHDLGLPDIQTNSHLSHCTGIDNLRADLINDLSIVTEFETTAFLEDITAPSSREASAEISKADLISDECRRGRRGAGLARQFPNC